MTSISTTQDEARASKAPARPLSDRLLAVVPLLSVYIWLCTVYMVEVLGHVTPWLFTDELEFTQLSRAIAATGRPAERGAPYPSHSLYTYLMAPFWLIEHVPTAYDAVKYANVFLMAAVVFPTYFLARMIVRRPAALFAAAGAGTIPALAYSGYVVEENLAYPFAALCFFLIAKAVVASRRGAPAWGWIGALAVATLLSPFVRGELGVVPAIVLLALIFIAWSSDWGRERRRAWTVGDYVGVVVLVFGAIFLISGYGSVHSYAWLVATRGFKHRMINMTGWALGTLAIGIGAIPLAAGLASLFRARGETSTRELRAFRSIFVAALISFGLYTAIKAAFLSTQFATRVEERNLIYVAPLLFVGTAFLLDRRRGNVWAVLGGAAFTAYLVGYAMYHPTQFPYEMNVQLYSDALGLAILQQANRYLLWTPAFARTVLLSIVATGTLVLLLLPRLRPPRVATGLASVLAIGIVGWSLTGQIAAAAGSNSIAREAAQTLQHPFSWVDDRTKGAPTLYMGEGEADQNAEWMLEFWNRSITGVSSLDGTVQGPGPSGGPNLTADGQLYWTDSPADPGRVYAYAVEDYPCVDLAGTLAGTHPHRAGGEIKNWRLIKLTTPNRLRAMCTGIYPDGWSGATDSAYFRFSQGQGWLHIVVSRKEWGGASGPSPVHLLVGKLVINDNAQPILGDVTHQVDTTIDSNQQQTCWLHTTQSRFAVHVVVDKKFVPRDYLPPGSPGAGDTRQLGAQVTYHFFPTPPKGATPGCTAG